MQTSNKLPKFHENILSLSKNIYFIFIYLFKQHKGQQATYNVHTCK